MWLLPLLAFVCLTSSVAPALLEWDAPDVASSGAHEQHHHMEEHEQHSHNVASRLYNAQRQRMEGLQGGLNAAKALSKAADRPQSFVEEMTETGNQTQSAEGSAEMGSFKNDLRKWMKLMYQEPAGISLRKKIKKFKDTGADYSVGRFPELQPDSSDDSASNSDDSASASKVAGKQPDLDQLLNQQLQQSFGTGSKKTGKAAAGDVDMKWWESVMDAYDKESGYTPEQSAAAAAEQSIAPPTPQPPPELSSQPAELRANDAALQNIIWNSDNIDDIVSKTAMSITNPGRGGYQSPKTPATQPAAATQDAAYEEIIRKGGSVEDIVEQTMAAAMPSVPAPPAPSHFPLQMQMMRGGRPLPGQALPHLAKTPAIAQPQQQPVPNMVAMHAQQMSRLQLLPAFADEAIDNGIDLPPAPPTSTQIHTVTSQAMSNGQLSVKRSYATMQGSMKPGMPCGNCHLDQVSLVCGSDGKTYPSACWVACMHLEVSHQGCCLAVTDVDGLLPTGEMLDDELDPGTLEDMFKGQLVQPQQQHLTVGNSAAPVEKASFCDCPIEFNPVCAEGGVTHPSRCYAACAKVAVLAEGPCDTYGLAQQAMQKQTVVEDATKSNVLDSMCACDLLDMELMCGEDDKTYNSRCWAKCAGVQVVYPGKCKSKAAH